MDFYRNASEKFLGFLGATAGADLTEITRDHITRFRNAEAKRFAPKTVNHQVKFLRMIFRAARRDALVADDPAEFVDTVRKGNEIGRRPFTIGEIKAVLTVADPDWRSMVMFGLYTGQRLGDVAMLTWQNIDLEHDEIRLMTRKTKKVIILPIAAPLKRHLEMMPSSDDLLLRCIQELSESSAPKENLDISRTNSLISLRKRDCARRNLIARTTAGTLAADAAAAPAD